MYKENKFSIVVPVYNVEKYLNQCVASLTNQTYKNTEIILIDDGSKDSSGDICDKLASKDNRIIVVHKNNEGVSATRNKGIELATGDYILFIDADDLVDTNLIETVNKKINEEESDVVIYGFWTYYSRYLKRDSHLRIVKRDNNEKEIFRISASMFNKAVKLEIFKSNPDLKFPKSRIGEDMVVSACLIPLASKVGYIDNNLYFYRQRLNSAMHTFTKEDIEGIFFDIDTIIEFYKKRNIYTQYQQDIEWIALKHVIESSIISLVFTDNYSIDTNKLLIDYINNRFPNYKNNKYLNDANTYGNVPIKMVELAMNNQIETIKKEYFSSFKFKLKKKILYRH